VARATIPVHINRGPNAGNNSYLTLPARLVGPQAVVSYNGSSYWSSSYEVSLCTYMCVETEIIDGFDEFRR